MFIPFLAADASSLYFEQYTPVYTLPFVFAVLYSSYRYKFFDISLSMWRWVVFLVSILISIGIIGLIKFYFVTVHSTIMEFWWVSLQFSTFDFIVWVLIFLFSYRILSRYILSNTSLSKFSNTLNSFKERVPFFSTPDSLNFFLKNAFKNELKIGFFDFKLNPESNDTDQELTKFFTNSIEKDVFINDRVFIEENKNRFNKKKILEELDHKASLIFPILDQKQDVLWFVQFGHKPFSDYYTLEEINELKNFVSFIQWHAKYLSIYSQIHELNVNLDKKVDEKTIEYNNLINRQKEFIAFVSHEIKNPVTNAMFLCDSALWFVKDIKEDTSELQEDISILNDELLKIGDLTKKIFSAEKYDLWKVKLFKEYTNVFDCLKQELEVFAKNNKKISFNIEMEDIWNLHIDRVQFRQVIHNLIWNAIKFSKEWDKCIQVRLFQDEMGKAYISIEDNGDGFKDTDISKIFDKYSTWESNSTGLGMWLYLCKRIVNLHWWVIEASKSKDLWWACFTIII